MGASEQSNHTPEPTPGREPQYIASFDLGTTTLRCHIYDLQLRVCGQAQAKVTLLYPSKGRVEMDPNELWEKFVNVVNEAISNAGLRGEDIRCLGVSTQRATFVTWDRRTLEPLHNFVTWKDIRSDALVNRWNNSWIMKAVRLGGSLLYGLLRSKRYLAASVLKFMNVQVNLRLKWVLENEPRVQKAARGGHLLFGTIDCWLVHKISGGKIHATDYSNASGTALYDPFIEDWNSFFINLLGIPRQILPQLKDSVGDWGICPASLFGAPIPITAVVSDQGASLCGSCGFHRGDVKMTLGTGAFLDLNTGTKPHASVNGIYPVHGWRDGEGLVHMAEASSNDNGTVIEWGQLVGLYDKPSETSELAAAAAPSNVYFIPAFQGIQAPVNDANATGGFLGLSATTGRGQLVRAMLESLAFRTYQMYTTMATEASYDVVSLSRDLAIRVDGGVAQNDFLLQTIATLVGKPLERPKTTDATAVGAAFLAGLGAGVWKKREDLVPLREVDRVFEPEMHRRPALLKQMAEWERAQKRFTKWHMKSNANGCDNRDGSSSGEGSSHSMVGGPCNNHSDQDKYRVQGRLTVYTLVAAVLVFLFSLVTQEYFF